MYVVGLTGGIGSGKSIVAGHFRHLGIAVTDADEVARQAVLPGSHALEQIILHFGSDIASPDGSLNRPKLRQIIFAEPEQRNWLETLLHPIIRTMTKSRLEEAKGPYTILESPLLLEMGQQSEVNRVLVVDVPKELQVARASERDNNSCQQIESIIDSQISRAERIKLADDILDNSGNIKCLKNKVFDLHKKYLKLAKS